MRISDWSSDVCSSDLALLDRLGQPGPVVLPRFDKATDDRAAPARAEGPFDIILFEGWCVGAAPQAAADPSHPTNALEAERDAHGVSRRHANATLPGASRAPVHRIAPPTLLPAPALAARPP